jgi:hypothetical protein
LDVAIFL